MRGKLIGIVVTTGAILGVFCWGAYQINELWQEILTAVDERRKNDPEWVDAVFVPALQLHRKYFPGSGKPEEYFRVRHTAGLLTAGLLAVLFMLIRL